MPLDLYRRDAAALSRLQHLRFFPLAVAEGRGSELVEPDGRALLDLSATWGAASLGYGHPAIRNAVARALEAPAGAGILSAVSAPAVELAEALLEITPGTGERRVWLGHSGSDANETVARAVLEATGRPRIFAFHGAYHGGTSGSMAVSGHSSQEGEKGLLASPCFRIPIRTARSGTIPRVPHYWTTSRQNWRDRVPERKQRHSSSNPCRQMVA